MILSNKPAGIEVRLLQPSNVETKISLSVGPFILLNSPAGIEVRLLQFLKVPAYIQSA